jgi:hypothetical protein
MTHPSSHAAGTPAASAAFDTSDGIVLLATADGRRAGKTFIKTGDQIEANGYQGSRHFHCDERHFQNFDDLVDILEAAEHDGRQLAVRGQPLPGVDTSRPIRRLLHDKDDARATFRAHPRGRRWLAVDIDNLPNTWGTPTSRDEMLALVQSIVESSLPLEFHQAHCWFQWSSSMGLRDWTTIKIHLWFLLQAPKTDAVLEQWAETNGTIDPCVYRTVQPNYLARPQFIRMADPLGAWRSGRGTWSDHAEVDLRYDYVEPMEFRRRATEQVKLTQMEWQQTGRAFHPIDPDHASPAMQRIAEIGVGGRLHMPIVRSAASWVRCCGAAPDGAAWMSLVRERVFAAGHKEAASRASAAYLSRVWRSAVSKFPPLNPRAPGVPPELIISSNRFE